MKSEPLEHIEHIAGDMARLGNASREASGRAQDLVQSPQPRSFGGSTECAALL